MNILIIRKFLFTLSVFSILAVFNPAFASGGFGGGFGGGGGYSSGGARSYAPKPVDPLYEQGKAFYTGRAGNYGKIKWCTNTATGFAKLKARHLKEHKTLTGLMSALHDCSKSEQRLAADFMEQEHFEYVLYYLIKRHKLKIDLNA